MAKIVLIHCFRGGIGNVPVVGVLPNCDEMMRLASSGLFCSQHPDHPLTHEIKTVAQSVMN